jgi:hypothetical protein
MLTIEMFQPNKFNPDVFEPGERTTRYFDIIQRAKAESRSKGTGIYFESHHIVPKSLGGNNYQCNMVLLTAQEHFICHQSLINITSGNDRQKMYRAMFRMVHGNKNQINVPVDANEYARLREQISQQMSNKFKGTTIPEERKQRISDSKRGNISDSHKQAISNAHKGKTPWNKGHKNQATEETRQKIRDSKLGKKRPPPSEETKQKMSTAHKGKKPWNAGVTGYKRTPLSEETKQKIRESRLRTEALRKASLINIIEVTPDIPHE